ncbi:hypothetical protein RCH12_002729 [Cryobacterium sp. MP_3.1]|nr:hypothetical protein [Cryobacterium sp. MP_3.1]
MRPNSQYVLRFEANFHHYLSEHLLYPFRVRAT